MSQPGCCSCGGDDQVTCKVCDSPLQALPVLLGSAPSKRTINHNFMSAVNEKSK